MTRPIPSHAKKRSQFMIGNPAISRMQNTHPIIEKSRRIIEKPTLHLLPTLLKHRKDRESGPGVFATRGFAQESGIALSISRDEHSSSAQIPEWNPTTEGVTQ